MAEGASSFGAPGSAEPRPNEWPHVISPVVDITRFALPDPRVPGDFVDLPAHYVFLEQLGKGSYGRVFYARDTRESQRPVAIKIPITPFACPERAKSCFREIALLKEVPHHQNIVRMVDLFHATDRFQQLTLFIALEYVEATLHHVRDQITEPHAVSFGYQILDAVKHLHSFGIVHRDLKPDNIGLMLHTNQIKVLDFGLARYLHHAASNPTKRSTGCYSSPEQVTAIPYDSKSDIWAVGCIIAEMISHHILFDFLAPGVSARWAEFLGEPPASLPALQSLIEIARNTGYTLEALQQHFPRDMSLLTQSGFYQSGLFHGMLQYSPTERFSAEACMLHHYFSEYQDEMVRARVMRLTQTAAGPGVDDNVEHWAELVRQVMIEHTASKLFQSSHRN